MASENALSFINSQDETSSLFSSTAGTLAGCEQVNQECALIQEAFGKPSCSLQTGTKKLADF